MSETGQSGADGAVLGGVFIGGSSRRMEGRAKGLLPAPEGGTLVERCARVLRAAGIAHVVLVGQRPEYARLSAGEAPFALPLIVDLPPGSGPLGGVGSLVQRAQALGASYAIALACDMPFVSPGLLRRLVEAPPALVVAPRRAGLWEPLCARYAAGIGPLAARRAATGDYSLQRLLAEARALELPLDEREAAELRDWDTPDDVALG